jgi:hypothetical protein
MPHGSTLSDCTILPCRDTKSVDVDVSVASLQHRLGMRRQPTF